MDLTSNLILLAAFIYAVILCSFAIEYETRHHIKLNGAYWAFLKGLLWATIILNCVSWWAYLFKIILRDVYHF